MLKVGAPYLIREGFSRKYPNAARRTAVWFSSVPVIVLDRMNAQSDVVNFKNHSYLRVYYTPSPVRRYIDVPLESMKKIAREFCAPRPPDIATRTLNARRLEKINFLQFTWRVIPQIHSACLAAKGLTFGQTKFPLAHPLKW